MKGLKFPKKDNELAKSIHTLKKNPSVVLSRTFKIKFQYHKHEIEIKYNHEILIHGETIKQEFNFFGKF